MSLSDSDKNIFAGLAHEACEWHCNECGCCSYYPTGPNTFVDVEYVEDLCSDVFTCADCASAS